MMEENEVIFTLEELAELVRPYHEKTAWTIGQLISKTRNKKTHTRAKRCSVRHLRFERSRLRWLYRVSCRERWSAPYHIARFRVMQDSDKYIRFTSKVNVAVYCSCPAWRYWGSAYWATVKRYNDGRTEGRPPRIRDPKGKNFLCKHVIAAAPFFLGWTVPVPEEMLRDGEVVEELKDF